MATINFLYRSKKERAPISLRLLYSNGGKNYVIGVKTKELIERDYWENQHQQKRPKLEEIKNRQVEVNSKLHQIRNYILEKFNDTDIAKVEKQWLIKVVEEYYNPPQPDYVDERVVYWINHIIDTAHTRENAKQGVGLSTSRVNSYKNLRKIFERYQADSDLIIKKLNKEWFDGFRRWLLEDQNYSLTYANKKISDLKTVCKEARG
ncbi:MAG: phage integrase SAM-like domain-containing protein, partial [Maribacter sp.]